MKTKTNILILVLLGLFISMFDSGQMPQTALGHITFIETNNNSDYKISLYKSTNEDSAVLIREFNGRDELGKEISIRYFNQLWQHLESIDQTYLAKRIVYCLDDYSIYKIAYGISDEVTFTINCLSYSGDDSDDQILVQIIELFEELKTIN